MTAWCDRLTGRQARGLPAGADPDYVTDELIIAGVDATNGPPAG